MTHQCLVFNLLSDELVLTEGIACLSSDGVYGSLLHLLFDGTEQHEERLASTLLCFGRETGDYSERWEKGKIRHRGEGGGAGWGEIGIHQHRRGDSGTHQT